MEVLDRDELPEWFEYPPVFLSVINQGLVDFHPWHILQRDRAKIRLKSIRERHGNFELVPFAWRSDSDVIACFERTPPGSVVVFEDSQPSISGKKYPTFRDWVRAAIEDMLFFEPEGSVWTSPRQRR